MSSVVSIDVGRELRTRTHPPVSAIDVALLGCGTVGSAVAGLAGQRYSRAGNVRITSALVRDPRRTRPTLPGDALRTSDGLSVFATAPQVVVELLGGIEPAHTLVCEALLRGIPVVTANKSLLAAHGRELRELAARTSTPLLYEAAVIAGVPFLGTFAQRPYASQLTSVVGIANGTTNYILTRAAKERCSIERALAAAQKLGLAEPDPSNDVGGIDALEKLVVLLQHFAAADVSPGAIENTGILGIDAVLLEQAAELGGTVKPVIFADWSSAISAFAGPAFVPEPHPLATVDGAENALLFGGPRGRILFRGPGAGPDVTAATVLDDVLEAARKGTRSDDAVWSEPAPVAPESNWLLSLTAPRLPRGAEIADLLASHGIFLQRTGARRAIDGREHVAALTWPAARRRLERAIDALAAAADGDATYIRGIES